MDRNKLLALLRGHLLDIIPELGGAEIPEDETLRDLGANSVDRGELITLTLERLELDIPRVELAGAQTLGELADLLTEKLTVNKNLPGGMAADHA